jgi:hypothetical protein
VDCEIWFCLDLFGSNAQKAADSLFCLSFPHYFEYSTEKSGDSEIWDKGTQVVGRKYCLVEHAPSRGRLAPGILILCVALALLGIEL